MKKVSIIPVLLLISLQVQSQVYITYNYEPRVTSVNSLIENGVSTYNEKKFKEYTSYNIPAVFINQSRYEYNWFAFKAATFSEEYLKDYSILNSTNYKEYLSAAKNAGVSEFWIGSSNSKDKGAVYNFNINLEITKSKGDHLSILAAETPSFFYASNTKTYHELARENSLDLDESIQEYLESSKLLEALGKIKSPLIARWTDSIRFSRNDLSITNIKFNADSPDESSILNQHSNALNNIIHLWADTSYLLARHENKDYRVSAEKTMNINLSRSYAGAKNKILYTDNDKSYFGKMLKSDLNNLILPKRSKLSFYQTSIILNVNNEIEKKYDFENFSGFKLPFGYYLSPFWSLIGCGYSKVSWSSNNKTIKTRKTLLSASSKVMLVTSVSSFLLKENFYRKYLDSPYKQNNNYLIANTANKVFISSAVLWSSCFVLDATLTIKQMNKTRVGLKKIKRTLM